MHIEFEIADRGVVSVQRFRVLTVFKRLLTKSCFISNQVSFEYSSSIHKTLFMLDGEHQLG